MNDDQRRRQLDTATGCEPLPADADAETTALREGWTALTQALSRAERSAVDRAAFTDAIAARLLARPALDRNSTTPRQALSPADVAPSSLARNRGWSVLAGLLLVALGLVAVATMNRHNATPPTPIAGQPQPPADAAHGAPTVQLAWNDAFDEQWEHGVTDVRYELVEVLAEWNDRNLRSAHVGEQVDEFDQELATDAL